MSNVIACPVDRELVEERRVVTLAALLSLYMIWGSTYYAMRVALETLPPFLMAGPRFVLAGAVMYAWLRSRGASAPSRAQWVASAKVSVLLLVVGNGAIAIAQRGSVSSSTSAVVVASMPIWAAVFARGFGVRSSGREWIGLLLGFAGVVLLRLGGALRFDGPAIVLLAAPIAWAFGSVWMKKLPLPEGIMASATQMITGGAAMLLLAAATGERLVAVPSTRSLLAVAYLMVFGSIVGFTAYNWLLRNVRPALATSYAYVNPIVALAIGAWLGGEPVGLLTVGAAAVSLLGVALISRA
ncbi:MAG: drug/metabolite exporter YedA [Deltaproteobacteria bacterium]|nr:drug/metabolite exporter YedA [Deltaproteobacteria bacterium]